MRSLPFLAMAVFLLALPLTFQAQPAQADHDEESTMTHVRGTFEVKMNPQAPGEGEPEAVGRMLLDKSYQGALDAIGQGQMLAFRSAVEGSAGYVAMEIVEGSLDGKSGSFVLQHSGLMNRGEPGLTLVVVPDSGTGELTGLSGTMDILIEEGQHFYEFDYSLGSSSGEPASED